MYIATISISNFRGIQNSTIHFKKHSVLVGPNNCGKSTIIDALALVLGRDRMIRTLGEHDFYGSNPQPTDRIHIIATITDFPSEEIGENPEWFSVSRGVPKWISEETNELHPTKTNDALKLCCQIAFSARYDDSSLEAETARYFYDDSSTGDIFDDESYQPVPGKLIKELGFFLIPANRSWDKVISFGSELFRRVISSAGGPPAEAVKTLRDQSRSPTLPLDQDPNLSQIVSNINAEMAGFFTSAPKLKLRLTTTDNEGILDSVVPHFLMGDDTIPVPARRHGNGLLSLQWILLLLEFGKIRTSNGEAFIMALEEPELHIPPAMQSKLVHRIQALSTQTITTTHSPMVASICDPSSLLVLSNKQGQLVSKPFIEGIINTTTPNALRKLYQVNRPETVSALLHDTVLIPEGRIDFDLLRMLSRVVDLREGWIPAGSESFGVNIGLIPTHDAAIEVVFDALSKIHTRVSCIVDGDSAGNGYASTIHAKSVNGTKILCWPQNWTIEDVIIWVLKADEVASTSMLSKKLTSFPGSIDGFLQLLKSENRGAGGMKGDMVVYETIMEVVYEIHTVNQRAQSLLTALRSTLDGSANKLFIAEAAPRNDIYVFQP